MTSCSLFTPTLTTSFTPPTTGELSPDLISPSLVWRPIGIWVYRLMTVLGIRPRLVSNYHACQTRHKYLATTHTRAAGRRLPTLIKFWSSGLKWREIIDRKRWSIHRFPRQSWTLRCCWPSQFRLSSLALPHAVASHHRHWTFHQPGGLSITVGHRTFNLHAPSQSSGLRDPHPPALGVVPLAVVGRWTLITGPSASSSQVRWLSRTSCRVVTWTLCSSLAVAARDCRLALSLPIVVGPCMTPSSLAFGHNGPPLSFGHIRLGQYRSPNFLSIKLSTFTNHALVNPCLSSCPRRASIIIFRNIYYVYL